MNKNKKYGLNEQYGPNEGRWRPVAVKGEYGADKGTWRPMDCNGDLLETSARSIDDLMDATGTIVKDIEHGRYVSALAKLDMLDGVEKDALYAGIALGLANELEKVSPECETLASVLINYCIGQSKYLRKEQPKEPEFNNDY